MPPKTLAPLTGDVTQGSNPPPSAPTALVFGIGQGQQNQTMSLKRPPMSPRPATTEVASPMSSVMTLNSTSASTASNPFTGYFSTNYAEEGVTSVDRQLAALKEKRRQRQIAFDNPSPTSTSANKNRASPHSMGSGLISPSSPIPAPPPRPSPSSATSTPYRQLNSVKRNNGLPGVGVAADSSGHHEGASSSPSAFVSEAVSMPPITTKTHSNGRLGLGEGGHQLPRTPPKPSNYSSGAIHLPPASKASTSKGSHEISEKGHAHDVTVANNNGEDAIGDVLEDTPGSFPRAQYFTTQAPSTIGTRTAEVASHAPHFTETGAEGEGEEGGEEASRQRKGPGAVSAATLKRRLAMEQKEKAKFEAGATDASGEQHTSIKKGATAGLTPWIRGRGGRGRGEEAVPAVVTAPPPPSVPERCKRLEEIFLLLQVKGPQAAALIETAMTNDGGAGKGGPKRNGKNGGGGGATNEAGVSSMSPSATYEWICHEKGLQELKTEVFDRWLRKDSEERLVLSAQLILSNQSGGSSKANEDSMRVTSPSVVSPQKKRAASSVAAPSSNSVPPPVTAQALFTSNALLRAYREVTLSSPLPARYSSLSQVPSLMVGAEGGERENGEPAGRGRGRGGGLNATTRGLTGVGNSNRGVVAREGDVLNSAGLSMYTPTEREIQLVLAHATPIVRACLASSENGRSTVSKLGTEVMGALCEALGVARLSGYFASDTGTSSKQHNDKVNDVSSLSGGGAAGARREEQYAALMCSPASRALDHHADALINKLITKGGTASVKFLYEVSAVALFQLLRGVSGSSNKVLIGVLLQSLGSNVPKTEKSRVLWGDAITFSLVQRWSMTFLAPALNAAQSKHMVLYLNARATNGDGDELPPRRRPWLGGELPTLTAIVLAVLTNSSSTNASAENLAARMASAVESISSIDGCGGAYQSHSSSSASASSIDQLLTLTTSPRDLKELLTRSLPVIDVLLADGSAEVRDAGRRVLLALVLLHEEHAAAHGYATVTSAVNTAPTRQSPASGQQQQNPFSGPYLAPAGGIVPNIIPLSDSGVSAGFLAPNRTSREVSTPSTPSLMPGGKEAVPTIDALISRTFADAKAKQDRLKEALFWARQAYVEGLVPLLMSFSFSSNGSGDNDKAAGHRQAVSPARASRSLTGAVARHENTTSAHGSRNSTPTQTTHLPRIKSRGASPASGAVRTATPMTQAPMHGGGGEAQGRSNKSSKTHQDRVAEKSLASPQRQPSAERSRSSSAPKGAIPRKKSSPAGPAQQETRSSTETSDTKLALASDAPPAITISGAATTTPKKDVSKGRPPRAVAPSPSPVDARRPSRMLRAGFDTRNALLSQLQDYVEGQGPSSRGQISSRGGTPLNPQSLSEPPEKDQIKSMPLSDEQIQIAMEWSRTGEAVVPLTVAMCIVALRNIPSPPVALRDKDREMALRYLLYSRAQPQSHSETSSPSSANNTHSTNSTTTSVRLPYGVGTALLDALLSKTTHSNHRIHGMCLQLLLLLCRPLLVEVVVAVKKGTGEGDGLPSSPLIFSITRDCVDSACSKGIGYLTTAMASSSGIVSTAAIEVVRSLVSIACATVLSSSSSPSSAKCEDKRKSHEEHGKGRGEALCSVKSLLHDLVSTAFATKNPTARAALLHVARGSVLDSAAAVLDVSDVRFPLDTCGSIVAAELSDLALTSVRQSLGVVLGSNLDLGMSLGSTGSLIGKQQKSPSLAATSCVASLRMLLSLSKCSNSKVKSLLPQCWEGNIKPAIWGYEALVVSAATEGGARSGGEPLNNSNKRAHNVSALKVAAIITKDDDAEYADDFETSVSNEESNDTLRRTLSSNDNRKNRNQQQRKEGDNRRLSTPTLTPLLAPHVEQAKRDALAALKEFAAEIVTQWNRFPSVLSSSSLSPEESSSPSLSSSSPPPTAQRPVPNPLTCESLNEWLRDLCAI